MACWSPVRIRLIRAASGESVCTPGVVNSLSFMYGRGSRADCTDLGNPVFSSLRTTNRENRAALRRTRYRKLEYQTSRCVPQKRSNAMKKLLVLVGLIMIVGLLSFAAGTGKSGSWNGWVSDAKCGAKFNADCAKKCIGAGQKPVLVTDNDQKVLDVSNP